MKRVSRQRGAIGLFGIVTLLLAILFTAVAVDTGRLLMQQRHLQTVADMAALDASSQTGHCGNGDFSAIQALANASAERNKHTGQPLTVSVGEISVNNGIREFSETPVATATAVMVEARKTVPASLFVGGILGHQTTLQAEAVAERDAIAGFSAGTALVSVSTQESQLLNLILGDILGSEINLDAWSYNGLADLELRLIDLAKASADIGTVEELLNTDFSVGQLLNLYADAVSNMEGPVNLEVLAGLNELIGANVSDLTVVLGDVINVTTQSPEMAANGAVNLFQLLTTSLMVANGQSTVALPLKIDVGGRLLNVSANLTMIEPPQIAIGPPGQISNGIWRTQMQTAQIRVATTVKTDLNLGLVRAEVDLGINIEVAQGNAWLQRIQCNTHNNQTIVTIVAKPGLTSVNITQANGSGSAGRIEVSTLLGILPVARIDVGVRLPIENTDSAELEYLVDLSDPHDLPKTKASSSSGSSLNFQDKVEITLMPTVLGILPLPLGGLLELLVGDVLGPILGAIGTDLLDPLLDLLGINIGVIDVQLDSVEISRPELKR